MLSVAGFAGSALAIAILGAAPVRLAGRVLAVAGAGLMLVWVAAISGVVFGEDTYVSDGSSRWANRGATEHTLYLVTAGVALAVAAVLGLLAIRDAAAVKVRGVLLVAGISALVAGWAVLVAFASN
jgi:hypothetical protein